MRASLGALAILSITCGGQIADVGDASTSNDATTAPDTSIRPPPPPFDGGLPTFDATPPPPGCYPGSLGGFMPAWHAPKKPSASCASGEIDTIAAACFGGSMCGATQKAHPTCSACLFSKDTDPNYGAVVVSSMIWRLFEGGCVAIEDNDLSASGCGAHVDANYQCQAYACQGCPPVTDVASVKALDACMQSASKTVCAKFQSVVNSCVGDGGPASACFGTDFLSGFKLIGNLMCAQ